KTDGKPRKGIFDKLKPLRKSERLILFPESLEQTHGSVGPGAVKVQINGVQDFSGKTAEEKIIHFFLIHN
ncbi:MAG TPA: hypothetical protein O0X17_02250, partial [Methanocorpusculum sp.]|nr:hypothetical protein [Methanocorpusculum sp.]